MRSLLTVEPYWVRVFHSVLCPRERLHVGCHWHTDRKNQNSSLTHRRMGDLQASIESARKGRTRFIECGLCHGVVLLLEDERDNITGVGSLVMKACLEVHDGKSYGRRTTKEGLYWMSPSGPPATTSIWAAFAGRADRRPSKVESAKSLENMTRVFEERSRELIEIGREECLMRHQWALRWTLYRKTIGLSALQCRDDKQDESSQEAARQTGSARGVRKSCSEAVRLLACLPRSLQGCAQALPPVTR